MPDDSDALALLSKQQAAQAGEFVRESVELDYAWLEGRLDEYLSAKLARERARGKRILDGLRAEFPWDGGADSAQNVAGESPA